MFPVSQKQGFEFGKAHNHRKSQFVIRENLEEMFQKRRSSLYVLPSISREVLLTAQHLLGCCVAGGAALGLFTGDVNKIKDWDLFLTGHGAHRAAADAFKRLDFKQESDSPWSTTYSKAGVIVQLIHHRFYNTVEEIFQHFDFSVCCFAIDGPFIQYTEQAKEDVAKGEMNLVYVDDLGATVKRIARYGAKGFKPTTEFVKDLIAYSKDTDPEMISYSVGCS